MRWNMLIVASVLLASAGFANAAALPYVDHSVDPGKFWTDHVHYPFTMQFAAVTDSRQREWEIAYADLYTGEPGRKEQAPVVVLLHGRAMNSGYWGTLLDAPLAAGWRVITIDWSNSGKSLPRNLHMPVNRSFEDTRQLVHQLVSNRLGIKKASYLGHSLGGQIAAGIALAYPDHVERLVLYAPAGIEGMPPIVINGVQVDDPALAKSPEAFTAVWSKVEKEISMGKTREEIEKSFYIAIRPGAKAYLNRDDKLGAFIVASRAATLQGNAQEKLRFAQAYAWDSMASLMETRSDDINSISNRMRSIKVPTLLAFGLKDSIIPMPLSGNTDLVRDVVQPFYSLARSRNAPIQIRLYDNAGHFIHTDLPEQFSQDVLSFLLTGKPVGPVYAGDAGNYGPKALAELRTLPDDLIRLKTAYEKAFISKDLAAVKEMFAPDFKYDGANREDRINYFGSFIGLVEKWEFVILSATPAAELLEIDFETRSNFGTIRGKTMLKKIDGEWRFYGNQQ